MGCGNVLSGPNSNHRLETTVNRPSVKTATNKEDSQRGRGVLDRGVLHRGVLLLESSQKFQRFAEVSRIDYL